MISSAMNNIFLFWILIGSNAASSSKIKAPRLPLRITNGNYAIRPDYVRSCTDVNHSFVFDDSSIFIYNRSTALINVQGRILRDCAGVPKKTLLKILKCSDAASDVTSCDISNWRFGAEVCSMVEMKNFITSPIFERIHPRIHCPGKKGKYELRNGTVDLTKFQSLPMENTKYHWRFRVELFDHDLWGCLEFAARLLWLQKS